MVALKLFTVNNLCSSDTNIHINDMAYIPMVPQIVWQTGLGGLLWKRIPTQLPIT